MQDRYRRLWTACLLLVACAFAPPAFAATPKEVPAGTDKPAPEPTLALDLGKGDRIITRTPQGVSGLAFSPDGKILATAGGDAMIHLWDTATGKELVQCLGHKGFVISVTFSPDGKTLASGGHDHEIILWDVANGKELRRLAGHVGGIHQVAFSPDGKTLASGGFDEHLRFWDLATGKELHAIQAHTRVVYAVAYSPDGKLVATGGDSVGIIRLWDAATYREVRQWKGHDNCVYTLTFSPDGALLASGGGDANSVLWEAATGKEVRRFNGHDSGVYGVAFSPDGRLLLTSSYVKTAHLWEIVSGSPVRLFREHNGWVWGVAYSPTGRSAATCSVDTTAVLWDLTGLAPGEKPTEVNLATQKIEDLWKDLAGADAARAQQAVWILAAAPRRAVPFLRERLVAAVKATPDQRQIAALIADLDNDQFTTREQATRQLEKLGDLAAPALRRALADGPSLEMRRRMEALLEKVDAAEQPPERLQALRALQILERIGSPEAQQVLEKLTAGDPDAALTQQARAALARLVKLSSRKP